MAPVNPRIQARLDDDLALWLTERAGLMNGLGPSQQAMTELGMWRSALNLELRRIRLTLPQAGCIADVCNGWTVDAALSVTPGGGLVFAECYDAFRLARNSAGGISAYGAQHGIDEQALLDYLGSLGPVADHALRDAIARWWHGGHEATVEGFGKVGLRVVADLPRCDPDDCGGIEDEDEDEPEAGSLS